MHAVGCGHVMTRINKQLTNIKKVDILLSYCETVMVGFYIDLLTEVGVVKLWNKRGLNLEINFIQNILYKENN